MASCRQLFWRAWTNSAVQSILPAASGGTMKPRGCRLELPMSLLFVCLGKVVWVGLLLFLMSGRDGG